MINNPISVFMHPRTFWNWKFSGVSRYVCELAEELIQAGVDVHIPIKETHNEYLKGSTFYHKTSSEVYPANISIRIIRKLLSLTPLKEKARRAELRSQALNFLRSNQFSLIHPTHTNATEILPYVGKTPLVITVHDMTHELFPESFATHDPSSERKRLFAQRADRIIAISECTKNDLGGGTENKKMGDKGKEERREGTNKRRGKRRSNEVKRKWRVNIKGKECEKEVCRRSDKENG